MKQAIALHTQKQQESKANKVRIINKGGGRTGLAIHRTANSVNPDIFATFDNISIPRYAVWSE